MQRPLFKLPIWLSSPPLCKCSNCNVDVVCVSICAKSCVQALVYKVLWHRQDGYEYVWYHRTIYDNIHTHTSRMQNIMCTRLRWMCGWQWNKQSARGLNHSGPLRAALSGTANLLHRIRQTNGGTLNLWIRVPLWIDLPNKVKGPPDIHDTITHNIAYTRHDSILCYVKHTTSNMLSWSQNTWCIDNMVV